jgi:hypothetical protein
LLPHSFLDDGGPSNREILEVLTVAFPLFLFVLDETRVGAGC